MSEEDQFNFDFEEKSETDSESPSGSSDHELEDKSLPDEDISPEIVADDDMTSENFSDGDFDEDGALSLDGLSRRLQKFKPTKPAAPQPKKAPVKQAVTKPSVQAEVEESEKQRPKLVLKYV